MQMKKPSQFLVLGGGITGLSTAWFLKKSFPTSKIILIESNKRLGGWIQTINHQGQLFETGPRTLRPNGFPGGVTLGMIHELGLKDQVVVIPKDHVAAKNRFILSEGKIHRLPSSLKELFQISPPFLKGFVWNILKEIFIKKSVSHDETVYDFMSRRFGKNAAEYLASAMVHGIYAGDCRELSMKSTMKAIWDAEKSSGSVFRGMLAPLSKSKNRPMSDITKNEEAAKFIREIQEKASIYAFKQGMQSLTSSIASKLNNSSQVQIKLNSKVNRIHLNGPKKLGFNGNGDRFPVSVSLEDGQTISGDYLFCTIPSNVLKNIEGISNELKEVLGEIKFRDVVVANLAYEMQSRENFPYPGFGYLVPMTEKSNILGTIFDSFAIPTQDKEGLVRFTVMMRPGDINRQVPRGLGFESNKYVNQAVESIQNCLNIPSSSLKHSLVNYQHQCIAQYTLGHADRLQMINEITENLPISLVGSSYRGVGINDCVHDAREKVEELL